MSMGLYMVLKLTGRGNRRGRSAIVVPVGCRGKNMRIVGNIPELCHGMCIFLELDENNNVLDYDLKLTSRNLIALEKEGYDIEEYKATLERHKIIKSEGLGWNVARLDLDEIYKALPFGEADKVHKEVINNPTEKKRIEALNKEVINTARNKRKIAYKIEEYLSYFDAVEQEGAYQRLMVSIKMLCLQASRYRFFDGEVWDNELKSKQEFVKNNIEERCTLEYGLLEDDEIASFIESKKESGLMDEQLNTLWCLKSSSPSIITGGAGTGKTTVIQTLIECYTKYYSKDNVLLVAPTGKASRRLAEKTRMPAHTIHKALRKNPEEDFVYFCTENPLPHRLIIVDESSMIDTSLMSDLLGAVDITSKVVFVGDCNQLYPVGYGEPFFDFLNKLEVFRLSVNHRQKEGTDILLNANRVLKGEELIGGKGVYIEDISITEIGGIVKRNDIQTQIISPYNDLNAYINALLKKGEDDLNVGDKIMTIKNSKNYCNGDIGYITNIDSKGNILVDIEGVEVKVTPANYDHLVLAYAITVHKMQGSESKKIIFLMPCQNTVDKRLLYTAITRAKSELEIYRYDENGEEAKSWIGAT